MSISLVKGQKISLTKEVPGLKKVIVGLGWKEKPLKKIELESQEEKPKEKSIFNFIGSLFGSDNDNKKYRQHVYEGNTSGDDIDIDASAILIKENTPVQNEDIVWFGKLKHYTGAVIHSGDDLTGGKEGDCEQIAIDLEKLNDYKEVFLFANIYKCVTRNQNFSMVEDSFIRLFTTDGMEICKYSLNEKASKDKTAIAFGKLYKHNGEWKFSAIGEFISTPDITSTIRKYYKYNA